MGCCQFGEVRLQANQQDSVSWDANRDHPREDLLIRLSYYQILRCSRHIPSAPIPTCEDVAADSRPHGLPGTVYSQGQEPGCTVFMGVPLMCQLVAKGGRDGALESLYKCPLYIFCTARYHRLVRSTSLGPYHSGGGISRGEESAHQHSRGECGSASLGLLQAHTQWKISSSYWQHHWGCDLPEEAGRDCVSRPCAN